MFGKVFVAFLVVVVLSCVLGTTGADARKYIAFGDSITSGSSGGPDGYEFELEALLQAEYGPDENVVNRGEGGEETPEGLERLRSVLSRDSDADYVLIMEGTNDIGAGREPSKIARNLENMANRVEGRGMTCVLATVIPMLRPREGWVENLNENYIKDLVKAKGILLADQFKVFTAVPDWEGLYDDDLHPNAEGYRVMAECWFDAILVNAPPQGVTGGGGDTSAELAWLPNTEDDVVGYNIYRRMSSEEDYTLVNPSPVVETAFTETGLTNGTTYYYTVVAVDTSGNESEFSTEVAITPNPGGGGCFIATAAYGTPLARDVEVLRRFRDSYLLTNSAGRALVRGYEKLSPPVAATIGEHPALRVLARTALAPIVGAARLRLESSFFTPSTLGERVQGEGEAGLRRIMRPEAGE